MITEIDIDPFEMREYDLTSIGLEGYKLVLDEKETYIEAEGDFFPIHSSKSFLETPSGEFQLGNEGEEEDWSYILITKEQYEAIKDLL